MGVSASPPPQSATRSSGRAARELSAAVNTILAMHIDEGDFLRLRSEAPEGCNFVVTGHMPSDSIGINRLIWELEDKGLECVRTSGIIGVPREAQS